VYNTGRTVAATLDMVKARDLPMPDVIIGSVGTEVFGLGAEECAEFEARLREHWDRAVIDGIIRGSIAAKPQPAEYQNPYKSSWYWVRAQRAELDALRQRIVDQGQRAHVDYSCRYFLDLVPGSAGKGNALAWLCAKLGIGLAEVLVAGDTANDTSMFLLPEVRGIVVANALPELRAAVVRLSVFTSQAESASGVLDGLEHFRLLERPGTGAAPNDTARAQD